jgi:hypothetical protein
MDEGSFEEIGMLVRTERLILDGKELVLWR